MDSYAAMLDLFNSDDSPSKLGGFNKVVSEFEYPVWPKSPSLVRSFEVIDDSHPHLKIAKVDWLYIIIPLRSDGTYFCHRGLVMGYCGSDTIEELRRKGHRILNGGIEPDKRKGEPSASFRICEHCGRKEYYSDKADPTLHHGPCFRCTEEAANLRRIEKRNQIKEERRIKRERKEAEYQRITKENAEKIRLETERSNSELEVKRLEKASRPRKKTGPAKGIPNLKRRKHDLPDDLTRKCPIEGCSHVTTYSCRQNYIQAVKRDAICCSCSRTKGVKERYREQKAKQK